MNPMKMMLRIVCAAAVAGMVMSAAPAEASIWGWLERLSGPGPFDQTFARLGVRGVCPPQLKVRGKEDKSSKARPRGFEVLRPSPDIGATCLYWDLARFVSHDDPFVRGTSDIHATVSGFGITNLMLPWLEVGAGVGRVHFSVENTNATVGKWTLTPARLVVRPVRFFCHENDCGIDNPTLRGSLNVFKVYFRTDVVLGTLRSRDFGVVGDFREKYDAVSSWGILLDFSELLRK